MEQVNERSTAYLTVTFRDKAGAVAAPSTVTYSIHDVQSGAAIRAATPVSAGGSVEIVLTPADNAILSANSEKELRRVTIEATYGAEDAVRAQFLYYVKNLRAVV